MLLYRRKTDVDEKCAVHQAAMLTCFQREVRNWKLGERGPTVGSFAGKNSQYSHKKPCSSTVRSQGKLKVCIVSSIQKTVWGEKEEEEHEMNPQGKESVH